ncbi:50S ribosomal protein L31 [Candidatus Giovannonibacteria bacterium RIFCSPHIGHO2_02_FULL_46_20]|uniref:Large ribosomal subunit protein bL31 n=1 Tax=Candidatus Giovannonibacteria bacterium RIFCSPHIGHO2_02_FULL_46_20 TaxID=1798338 RepID=A0A1F5WF13_9BACT|nr:MAG: 50S ribosomal protein L31 [Candidatus Giovannonibacteria bacterium RIFCSPHIGHO2_02_FULL_46_20]
MKPDIHPTYYKQAGFLCSCGASRTLGATKKSIRVEICSRCHPFYTGKEKLVDAAGRVEKFKVRASKAKAAKKRR